MTLSIIIVNWKSKDFLRRCLTSLQAHRPDVAFEVVVVDGGSFDGCAEMLAAEFPSVIFVQSRENIGFARANNLGVRHSSGRYLLLLNPDTEFVEDAITPMLRRMEDLPVAGAVGCRLLNRDMTLQGSCVQAFPTVLNQALDSDYLRGILPGSRLWGTGALLSGSIEPAKVEVLSGACILVKRECFESVDGFTEHYFMYGEDLDLCFKLGRAGFNVYHLPETRLVHFGGASTGKAAGNFSTVMMRESVYRFMRLNRGPGAALGYRLGTMFSAAVRLALMGPLMLFGNRIVRHGSESWRKWFAILSWSLGFGPHQPSPPPKACPPQCA